ncbi:molybdenum cofactor biosynthesis protein C, partial [Syncephalis pseudoplumigaleata]
RVARASACVHLGDAAYKLVADNKRSAKGDVLTVAQLAGIQAAKRTADLIPLCHPLQLSHIGVDLQLVPEHRRVDIMATVTCTGKTGVEMEALTAASVAALTVFDMCKAADKRIRIDAIRVVEKRGGKSGHYQVEDD